MEALFRAYFTEGRDISKRLTLIDVVAEAGLDQSKAEAELNSDDGLEPIRDADALARRFRVDGVDTVAKKLGDSGSRSTFMEGR